MSIGLVSWLTARVFVTTSDSLLTAYNFKRKVAFLIFLFVHARVIFICERCKVLHIKKNIENCCILIQIGYYFGNPYIHRVYYLVLIIFNKIKERSKDDMAFKLVSIVMMFLAALVITGKWYIIYYFLCYVFFSLDTQKVSISTQSRVKWLSLVCFKRNIDSF